MTDHQSPADDQAQQLLEHYRQQHDHQPSAAMDARILAAASAMVKKHESQPLLIRVQQWLLGGSTGRWSIALGSLAVVGLAVGLVFNTMQPTPSTYDSPHPVAAAPALQRYAEPQADSAPLQRKRMESAPAASVIAEMAEAPQPVIEATVEDKSLAKMAPSADAIFDELLPQLKQVIELREAGETEQAEEQVKGLKARYPGVDIEQQLHALTVQDK